MNLVKKRVTKPDGTVAEEFFDPSQFLMSLRSSPFQHQMLTTPSQVPPKPDLMLPQSQNLFSNLIKNVGDFLAKPENFGLLGQAANAIAPNTPGGNLGLAAYQNAIGQLLKQLLSGAGQNP